MAQLACGGQALVAVGKQIAGLAGTGYWRNRADAPMARKRSAAGGAAATGEWIALRVEQVELKALKTLPPKPYTQGELVKAMKGVAKLVDDPRLKQKLKETTGIGTEATRASTIKGPARSRLPAEEGPHHPRVGCGLHAHRRCAGAIADPGMTAIWEQALDMIEAGQMTLDTFIAKQSAWVAQLVQEHQGATLSIRCRRLRRLVRSAARRCASVPAGMARSGHAAVIQTAGTLPLESWQSSAKRHASGAQYLRRADVEASSATPAASSWRRTKRTAFRGTPARLLLQRCARSVCPPSDNGREATAPRIAPTAIPLIGVSCFGHARLPDGLPPLLKAVRRPLGRGNRAGARRRNIGLCARMHAERLPAPATKRVGCDC